MRIGINCGKLVAGVIGKTKFIYDIWGDAVNVASRMESSGQPGKIHVTDAVYEATKNDFSFSEPVEMEIKGKGAMKTYFLV
jgi:class 3 adenylate cyclase